MKTKSLYTAFIPLLVLLNASAQEKLPPGVSQDWYTKTSTSIRSMEYEFHSANKNQNFNVANPRNYLAFNIDAGGYAVHNMKRKNDEKTWDARFSIIGVSREKEMASLADNSYVSTGPSSITYHSASFDVEYTNDVKGLRQNFIIKEKPVGEGSLTANIRVATSLHGVMATNNKLTFSAPGDAKDVKLIYDGLKVWDAANTVLPATMIFDATTNTISIEVDDKNAVYPVTIDPLNRTAEWTTSADGILPGLLTNLQLQVQTAYGYTVASLGDINGDGFDDVSVSAPTMADVVSGTGSLTGVGAVFIYLGSASGLSTTPAKVLQPTTALDGALFGFSVDAGDITGDGKNDIIISAPLDRYTTMASGLLGPTSVEVTAGKVYMYRSEDLFSAPNPTPFLEIRLQGTNFFSTGIAGLALSNVGVKCLFGYSVAVTNDLNGDNKADIVIGVPSYLGVDLLSAQSGAAFIYYSDNLATTSPVSLNTPTPTLLGLVSLPIANTSGLLFGFSVDGAGDFDNDGKADVVIGAPAGADLSSLGGIFSGQFLGGSAYVFYGTGAGVNTTSTVRLQASVSGLLSNAANLFGYKVKGLTNAAGNRTGGIVIGAPVSAVLSNVVGGLQVKAGEVHLFKKKTIGASGAFTSDQALSSPRSSSILSILAGNTINVSLLYGSSIDNMLDVDCDGIGDLIVGEPLSTAVPVLGADVVGGAAYVYLGKPDGTFNTTPIWDLYTDVSPLLGVNATALLGYSVAGARYVKGHTEGVRALVGGPSNALDFGVGLLNLGNTLGTTLDFAFDNNGLGKAYEFPFTSCNIVLGTTLLEFKGIPVSKTVALNWTSVSEPGMDFYELQRSTDGINFETLTIANAKGAQRNDYNYIDKLPFMGMNYYRLKMVDKDKQFTYSNIIAVRFDEKLSGDVVVAPNPVQGDITLRMTGMDKGVYRVELKNTAGQTMLTKSITVNQFVQTETIQRNGAMATGIYWLNFYDITNRKIRSLRILVSK